MAVRDGKETRKYESDSTPCPPFSLSLTHSLSLSLSFSLPFFRFPLVVGARSFFARFLLTTQMPRTRFLLSDSLLSPPIHRGSLAPSRFLYYLERDRAGSFASLVTQTSVSMGYIYRVCFAFHTPIVLLSSLLETRRRFLHFSSIASLSYSVSFFFFFFAIAVRACRPLLPSTSLSSSSSTLLSSSLLLLLLLSPSMDKGASV